jgi:hypothetical protein
MPPWKAELCCDVVARNREWLWPGYLARGKLALLDGDPEMGKSLLTIDPIARLSRGGPLPDGSTPPRPRTSLLLPAEDDGVVRVGGRGGHPGVGKGELRVGSHRTWDHVSSRGEWYWYDPDAAWPKDAPFRKPRELPPLLPL